MKTVKALQWAAVLILLGLTAAAQEFPRYELGADYSFVRFNPNAQYTQSHSLNGGGGSMTINWNEFLGIKVDFQGYQATTNGFTIPSGLSFPGGASGKVSGDLFTYMIG